MDALKIDFETVKEYINPAIKGNTFANLQHRFKDANITVGESDEPNIYLIVIEWFYTLINADNKEELLIFNAKHTEIIQSDIPKEPKIKISLEILVQNAYLKFCKQLNGYKLNTILSATPVPTLIDKNRERMVDAILTLLLKK